MMNKLIRKKLQTLSEEINQQGKVPGVSQTDKVQAEEDKINKAAGKESKKNTEKFDQAGKTKDDIEPKKRELTSDEEELRLAVEKSGGIQNLKFDGEVSEEYKDRQEKAIKGDSTMGNANTEATEPAWDASKEDFGQDVIDQAKATNDLENDTTITKTQLGDDIEVVDDEDTVGKNRKIATENKKENKNTIKETPMKKKRLKFKAPFNGVDKAVKLIPEHYKVDDKNFEMTDGNETYDIRWEGSLTEGTAIVLRGENKQFVNEDMAKIKHLFGYKSEDTLGLVKGSARVDENKAFSDVWDKTKSLLTESDDEDDDEATLPLDKLARESEEVAEGEEITEEEDINGGAKTTEKKPDEKLPQAADAKKDVIKGVVAEEEIEEADEITEDDVEEGCEDKK